MNSLFDVAMMPSAPIGKDEQGRLGSPHREFDCGKLQGFQGQGGLCGARFGRCEKISEKLPVSGTDVACVFQKQSGRGGVVENIYISEYIYVNITRSSCSTCLWRKSASESLPMAIPHHTRKAFPVQRKPRFRNIYVGSGIEKCPSGYVLNGLPDEIENINLENELIAARYGEEFSESKDISLKNVHVIPEEGPAYLFNNVKNFKAEGLAYAVSNDAKVAKITGANTSGLHLSGLPEEEVDIATDVNKKSVEFN